MFIHEVKCPKSKSDLHFIVAPLDIQPTMSLSLEAAVVRFTPAELANNSMHSSVKDHDVLSKSFTSLTVSGITVTEVFWTHRSDEPGRGVIYPRPCRRSRDTYLLAICRKLTRSQVCADS